MYSIGANFGELIPDANWNTVPGQDWEGGKIFTDPATPFVDRIVTTSVLPTRDEAVAVSRAQAQGYTERGYTNVSATVQADNSVQISMLYIPRYWVGREMFDTREAAGTWAAQQKARLEALGWAVTDTFIDQDTPATTGKFAVSLTLDTTGSTPVPADLSVPAAAMSSKAKIGLGLGLALSGLFVAGGIVAIIIARKA